MTDTLTTLLQRLDEPAARYSELEHYYSGTQPLAFLAPESRTALGDRFGRMASNIPRLAITSLTERLRVTGFSGVDVWDAWLRNDLDQTSTIAHREALLLGASYAIVWADHLGRPKVTIESAKQVTMLTDPGTRQPVAALKRWETATTTEAVLYGPAEIVRLRAEQPGATTQGFKVIETLTNPLGVVPVVRLTNSDRLLDDGVSEIEDLKPLVDALNKTLTDMLTTSEYVGRPRRWATGIELEEDEQGDAVNPIPEGNRAMISENPDAKFGQLDSANLGGYEAAVRIILGQIMAVSALPSHYIGQLTATPPSADALRAAEASLTARAQARQQVFGRAWEQVARLIVAVRDGADPHRVEPRIVWADPATRSIGQEADAIVKLYSSGLLPADYALQRLGYGDDEITAIRKARQTAALDNAAVDLSKLVS
ncbi:phage portal protein [Gordonia phthalatica]|uniref:Phage portal protein, SPP1 Gp6 n=1 Tax=Gordonia phthalatica TaxID=1136941 RepID=A0A0N9NJN2_9ACTN|nr:phage portal protein [Gordonia phthalatica]ALG85840.1 phage portal protein, SPP1 Gp6 [Gordonia phthalatica]